MNLRQSDSYVPLAVVTKLSIRNRYEYRWKERIYLRKRNIHSARLPISGIPIPSLEYLQNTRETLEYNSSYPPQYQFTCIVQFDKTLFISARAIVCSKAHMLKNYMWKW